MSIAKKIILKLLLLTAILVVMNYIYVKWFYEKDIQKYSNIIKLVRDVPINADVIYIGESSNITFRGDDIDKRPISSFISDYYPSLKFYDITKPAAHAGTYKVLLSQIPDSSKVKTVIVTLNLRSFDATWIHSKLETSLQKSTVLLQQYPPLFNRFMLSFKAYDIKSENERTMQVRRQWKKDIFKLPFSFRYTNVIEWDNGFAHAGIRNEDSTKNIELTQLACNYIKGYAFQIDTLTNPRIKDFDDIIEMTKKRRWNLVFNLMSENTEKAKELVGDTLIYFMEENRKLLINYFSRKGVTVVDNLNDIKNNQFIDQKWTTEHYAEKGRKIIAKNVADTLRKFYPNEFVEPVYKKISQNVFFNNCDDKNNVWFQMKTITDEKSFSQPNSSKTGNGNDYSVAFQYPFNSIADSLKNKIDISFKAYMNFIDKKADLVIQADGKNIKPYSKSWSLTSQITKANRWIDFNIIFKIPDKIKNADRIKIFIYNPSDKIVYIDDFRIEFK